MINKFNMYKKQTTKKIVKKAGLFVCASIALVQLTPEPTKVLAQQTFTNPAITSNIPAQTDETIYHQYKITENNKIIEKVDKEIANTEQLAEENCAKNQWVGDCYVDNNGEIIKNQWIEERNQWYYLTSDGNCAKNQWMDNCYLSADGSMMTNDWIYDQSSHAWYYLTSDGTYATNTTIDGQRINEKGQMITTIPQLENKLNRPVYNGQCYGLSAYYVDTLNGPKLMGSGKMCAERIGSDYNWANYGFEVINNPSYNDIQPGDIIQWKANTRLAPGPYGHTGIVRGTLNGKLLTYEQNAGRGQICAKYTRDFVKHDIKSIVRKIS